MTIKFFDVAADHQFDDVVMMNVGTFERTGVLPVTQNDHAVGDLFDLAQPMRDINDADPFRPKVGDDR